jgi:hypothetical protein
VRICSKCGGGLKQGDGWEQSSIERAGNPRAVDEFHCLRCGRLYWHSYEERFTGDIENWSYRERASDPWAPLPQDAWPTDGEPEASPDDPGFVALPEPDEIIYLPHFNNQAVLEYDRETGLHEELEKNELPADARYWRGFYMPDGDRFVGVYATAGGPMFFADTERTLLAPGRSVVHVENVGKQRLFRIEHDETPLTTVRYTPLPSGFDAWSQDEAFVDFYLWLQEGTVEAKWYAYYTVDAGEDVTWKDAPPEPDPGPRFGEYVLVWDSEGEYFPVRMRLLAPGEDPKDFPDRRDWTGVGASARGAEIVAGLRARYAPPRFFTVSMYGDDWQMAARKFCEIFQRGR